MLDSTVKNMLFLYVDHLVCLSMENGDRIEGELLAVEEDAVALLKEGEVKRYSFAELTDVRYVGNLTDYRTFAGTGEIDNTFVFDISACSDETIIEKIKYQEYNCTMSCHLVFDMQIKAADIRVERFYHVRNMDILGKSNYLYTFTNGTCLSGMLMESGETYSLVCNNRTIMEFDWKEVEDITRQPVINDEITVYMKTGEVYSGIVCAAQQEFCNIMLGRTQLQKIRYAEMKRLFFHGEVTECMPGKHGVVDNIYRCKYPHYLQSMEQAKLFQYGAKVMYMVGINQRAQVAKEVEVLISETEKAEAEHKIGIILTIGPITQTGSSQKWFGYIGNKYVMQSCGEPVRGDLVFYPDAQLFTRSLNLQENIYVVRYTPTGQLNERGQQPVTILEMVEAIPKKYIGMVEIVDGVIVKTPLYQAVIGGSLTGSVYKNKEVEIICKDGSTCTGIVAEHNEKGFTLHNGELIDYTRIENVRIFDRVSSYGDNGVGFTVSGLRFHVNDSALDMESVEMLAANVRISYVLANNLSGNDRKVLWKFFNIVEMKVWKDSVQKPVEQPEGDSEQKIKELPEKSPVQEIAVLSEKDNGMLLKQRFGEIPGGIEGGYGILHKDFRNPKVVYVNSTYRNPRLTTEKCGKGLPFNAAEVKIHAEELFVPGDFYIVRYKEVSGEAYRYEIEFVGKIRKSPSLMAIDIEDSNRLFIRIQEGVSAIPQKPVVYQNSVPEVTDGETVFYEYERILGNAEANYYGLTMEAVIHAAEKAGLSITDQDIAVWRFGVLENKDYAMTIGILNRGVEFELSLVEQKAFNILKTAKRKMMVAFTCKNGKIAKVKLVPDEVLKLLCWQKGTVTSCGANDKHIIIDKKIVHYLSVRSDGLVNNYAKNGRLEKEEVYVKVVHYAEWGEKKRLVSAAAEIHLQVEMADILYNTTQNRYMAYRNQTQFVALEDVSSENLAALKNTSVGVRFVPEPGSNQLKAYLMDKITEKISPEENFQRKVEALRDDFKKAAGSLDIYRSTAECLAGRTEYLLKELSGDREELFHVLVELKELSGNLAAKQGSDYTVFQLVLEKAAGDISEMQRALKWETEVEQILAELLDRLEAMVGKDLNDLYKKSAPKISCRPNVTEIGKSEQYLYILLSNEGNKQPAAKVRVILEATELPDGMLQREVELTAALEAGAEAIQVPFRLAVSDFNGDGFLVNWTIKYQCITGYQDGRNELGDLSTEGTFELLIANGEQNKNREAKNPYEEPAKGMPLKTREMFFGRVRQLVNFWNHVLDKETGKLVPGKMTIIYGLRRSGKSSLVHQIMNTLNTNEMAADVRQNEDLEIAWKETEKPYVIYFRNMGGDFTYYQEPLWFEQSLYFAIMDQLGRQIPGELKQELLAECGCIRESEKSSAARMSLDKIIENPVTMKLQFKKFIEGFRRLDQDRHKLVLIMDEFTTLCVKAANYTAEGYKNWENVPTFINSFADMGFIQIVIGHSYMMTSLERLGILNQTVENIDQLKLEVSELDSVEAKKLIIEPMESAFGCKPFDSTMGVKAVENLLDLSGRLPLMIMRLCNRLFEYFRRSDSARIVTDDVQNMLLHWFKDQESVTKFNTSIFDVLIEEDSVGGCLEDRDTWKFLEHVAKLSMKSANRDCDAEEAFKTCESLAKERCETIAKELDKRGVISREDGRIKIFVGLFGKYNQYKKGW
ncbi:MAG: ATP-binding protein [Lachnospiraceae bacterium]|nr:ATP-binding protein [Lachnospiraceae bacterium]